ncbi:MAG TPA: PAS domain S-box protein [Candidatus Lokiarchaeia archaeon]|nr:PAS domain S-box protein [Candidatus Lokiarchaeia archaeon]
MENSNIDSDAEGLLGESNEHFHDLFENMLEGVAFCQMIFDDAENPVDWIYLYVNPAFGSLTGLENIVGMHATEAISGIQESSSELFEVFGRVASTGQPESFEIDFKPSSLWLKVSASSPVKNYFVAIFENITGRKSMEEELRKSEDHSMMLADLLEKSSQPFAMRFLDGKMSIYNDAFCKLVGYTKEELVDFDALQLTPLEWVEREKVFLDELKDSGQSVQYEKEYIRKDGSRVPIEVFVNLIRDDAGQPKQYYGFYTDITERKRMEQELQLKDFAFKSSITPETIANMEGFITNVNDSFVKTWGYESADELIGMRMSMCHADPNESNMVIETAEKSGFWSGEYIAKKKDGSTFIAMAQKSLVLNKDGNPIALYTAAMDITDRKRAEEELRIRAKIGEILLIENDEEMFDEVLRIVLETLESEYGVFGYLDEDGALVEPTMTRQIWDKCQVPDKRFIFPRDTWGNSTWARAIREKRTIYSNISSENIPEGHIGITRHISIPIIHQGNVVGLVQVANKITDYTTDDIEMLELIGNMVAPILDARLQRDREGKMREIAENQLKGVLQNLMRSNRDLEQFAYVASHDLQEPLRMVSSYVKLLERRYKGNLDADADDFINFAVDGAVRMQALINDLLLFSRVHTRGKEFEVINFEDVLATATNNLRMQIDENEAIITHDPLPTIMIDRAQITQVLQNLISNGIKFHRDEESPRVHVSAKENDDEWTISVQDNGIGIESQYYDRLFIIFQRLNEKGKYPGTGIGLAICKRIIERHDGRIWLESEPGTGSTFYFSIPKNLKNTTSTIEANLLEQL